MDLYPPSLPEEYREKRSFPG